MVVKVFESEKIDFFDFFLPILTTLSKEKLLTKKLENNLLY